MARQNTEQKGFTSENIRGIGFVGQDPEQHGKVVSLTVAANSRSYDRDGNEVNRTEWRNLKVFGRDSERVLDTVKKGDKIKYEGRLSPVEYENKNGDIVETWDVLIDFDGITILPMSDEERDEAASRRADSSSRSRRSRTEDDEDEAPRKRTRRSRAEDDEDEEDEEPRRRRRSRDEDEDDIDLEDEAPRKRTRRSRRVETDDDIDDYTESVL